MKYACYIIYSKKLNKFYIGETEDLILRLFQHNSRYFKCCYTSKASDWELYHLIVCETREQARRIESHIKRMKNKKYIENLSIYPEISEKLLIRYK
ncbi:MAG: GIY-YIG nuclease family protein [Bacteroidales bacterium]